MESSALNFQSAIQSVTFKTFYHNQTQQFGYDDLFLNKRVVIFSIPKRCHTKAFIHYKEFDKIYNDICSLNVDNVYAINSCELFFLPWAEAHSKKIMGLLDQETKFVSALAELYNNKEDIGKLANFWQYIMVLNNGQVEKFWQNHYKSVLSLKILKSDDYQYRKIPPGIVIDYLKNNSVDTQQ